VTFCWKSPKRDKKESDNSRDAIAERKKRQTLVNNYPESLTTSIVKNDINLVVMKKRKICHAGSRTEVVPIF
ncbi:MAG TPA: hypothetical protein PKC47_13310, partial [Petrimonas sp.]|nr:hypothetical protein [Petrimonas sp.]